MMLQVVSAVLASLFFNLSPVLQSIDARASSSSLSFRPALIVHLVCRPVWLLGTCLGAAAVGLEMFSLTTLPLGFVQPLLAGGILVIPLASALLLDEPPASPWFAGSGMIIVGVLILGTALPQATGGGHHMNELLLLLLAALAVSIYFLLRDVRSPGLLAAVAGCALGADAVFLKTLSVSFGPRQILALVPVLAAFAAIGFLAEMSALQQRSATGVVPTVLALTTVIPVFVGHVALGEVWPRPGLTLLGFALTLLPALWIAAHFAFESPGHVPPGGAMRRPMAEA